MSAPPGGDGTKEKPYTTITDALGKVASSGRRRIYICGASTYAEHVKLDATNAARLIGGFDCTTWAPAAGQVPKVAPSDAGYALQIDNVTSPLQLEDLAFASIAGTATSRSSIAVFVANSPNVTLKRLTITAAAGFDGADGNAAEVLADGSVARKGNAAVTITGGAAKVCDCATGGSSQGGKGGDTDGAQIDGQPGLPSYNPATPPGATGSGQTSADCNAVLNPARPGSRGTDGAIAPKPSVGALTLAGWAPGAGSPGTNGMPGQGGGGGGSKNNGSATVNGAGGGGACGGCGGSAGGGGEGGGSSIALITFESQIRLLGGSLSSSTASKGGAGRAGGAGGGESVGGDKANNGCAGAGGGAGGTGGSGAGGAGGVSAAILHKGPMPTNDGATLTNAAGGKGGTGGTPGTNDGPPGLEGPVVAAP